MDVRFIDTHTHLTDEEYGDPAAVVADFGKDRLEFVIDVGCDIDTSIRAVRDAERFEPVYAAVGVHPHDAESWNGDCLRTLTELAASPKVVAFGEIGLDYHYDFSDRESQRRAFAEQLELADSLGLPVVFHAREATGEFNEILKANRRLLRHGGVMHCYANGAELVRFYADLGLYFGFGGSVTFKNARGLLEAVKAVPADRILTETDCPYLTPVPHRGEINYPKFVSLAAERCAELRGIELPEFCAQVRENALRLFSRIKR